jgi:hypothetical protein
VQVNSAMAAMAYAKLHDRLGVCVATSGQYMPLNVSRRDPKIPVSLLCGNITKNFRHLIIVIPKSM